MSERSIPHPQTDCLIWFNVRGRVWYNVTTRLQIHLKVNFGGNDLMVSVLKSRTNYETFL